MKFPYLPLYLLIFAILGCEPEPIPAPQLSPEANLFLNSVMDTMEQHAVFRGVIDWESFRRRVVERADGAQETENTYAAIQLALSFLGDNHSFFIRPDGITLTAEDRTACSAPPRGSPSPPSDIGYVHVPSTSAQGEEANEFATQLQESLIALAEKENWIIDLRGNTGGNYYPMLAGIGPILGAGTGALFIKPGGDTTFTYYRQGESGVIIRGDSNVAVTVQDYLTDFTNVNKIAVLIDGFTASSGEATALAIMGEQNVRTFGLETCGLTTSNESFPLSDGSVLILSTGLMALPDGTVFPNGIKPQDSSPGGNQTFNAALRWIRE